MRLLAQTNEFISGDNYKITAVLIT